HRSMRLSWGHPGRRLVEHQDLRIARQDEAYFEPALIAVRQVLGKTVGDPAETDVVENCDGLAVQVAHPAAREQEVCFPVMQRLDGEAHVLVDAELPEDIRDLERARDAETRALKRIE